MQSNTIRRDLEAVKIFFLQMCNFAVDQGVSRKGKTGFARGRASRSQGARQTREARGRHAKRGRGTRDAHRARGRNTKHAGISRSGGTHQARCRHGEARGGAKSARTGRQSALQRTSGKSPSVPFCGFSSSWDQIGWKNAERHVLQFKIRTLRHYFIHIWAAARTLRIVFIHFAPDVDRNGAECTDPTEADEEQARPRKRKRRANANENATQAASKCRARRV